MATVARRWFAFRRLAWLAGQSDAIVRRSAYDRLFTIELTSAAGFHDPDDAAYLYRYGRAYLTWREDRGSADMWFDDEESTTSSAPTRRTVFHVVPPAPLVSVPAAPGRDAWDYADSETVDFRWSGFADAATFEHLGYRLVTKHGAIEDPYVVEVREYDPDSRPLPTLFLTDAAYIGEYEEVDLSPVAPGRLPGLAVFNVDDYLGEVAFEHAADWERYQAMRPILPWWLR